MPEASKPIVRGLLFAGLLAVSTLAFLIVAPLLLLVPGLLFSFDWIQLSAIGQSYTGVAAVLSAAALLGVAYSVNLQQRQNSVIQGQAIREMQFALLRMAMHEADLAEVVSGQSLPSVTDHERFRKRVFRTQWLRYLEFLYFDGELEHEVERVLREEFFASVDNRNWWRNQSSEYWRAGSPAFYAVAQRAFIAVSTEGGSE